jgi:tetrapyrrole methylase family protein/MazG family protein
MYSFIDFVRIIAHLRSPEGCPWDRQQTHQTILRYLIEECYEFVDAARQGDTPHMADELGDILLQVVLHSQLAKEQGSFDIRTVINLAAEKMIRRHPHVFGTGKADTPEQVLQNWDDIKAQEKGKDSQYRILEKIPRALPSLYYAEKMQQAAAKVGFDWPEATAVLEKVQEEIGELKLSLEKTDPEGVREEIGDLLFALVNFCRHRKLDPEETLRRACEKFKIRFAKVEDQVQAGGKPWKELSLAELDRFWETGKKILRTQSRKKQPKKNAKNP